MELLIILLQLLSGAYAPQLATSEIVMDGIRVSPTTSAGNMMETGMWDFSGCDATGRASLRMTGSGIWDGEDFRYDANGNQTRDMSRGVADVTYNVLNLPQTVTLEDGSCISYVYMATGAKLAETVKAADGDTIVRRDYVGNLELTTDADDAHPDIRLLLPDGYLTLADTVYHAYIPDYQGNIVGVYNSGANRLEQYTDYYPYGLPHATSLSPTTNRRKFGGKELATDLGLNLHDFAARWQNPALGRFTTPDPLLDKYRDISPYLFCAGDPINHIDPTGMIVKALTHEEQSIILNTLRSEDRQYVVFSDNGVLKSDVMRSHTSDSPNYNTLLEMANSLLTTNVLFQNEYIYSDNEGNVNYCQMGEIGFEPTFAEENPVNPTNPTTGEDGFYGKTLLPGKGESGQNSIDDQIYVIINNGLSKIGAAQAFSHEMYGHGYLYIKTRDRKFSAHHFQKGGRDSNRELIMKIIDSIVETGFNIKDK